MPKFPVPARSGESIALVDVAARGNVGRRDSACRLGRGFCFGADDGHAAGIGSPDKCSYSKLFETVLPKCQCQQKLASANVNTFISLGSREGDFNKRKRQPSWTRALNRRLCGRLPLTVCDNHANYGWLGGAAADGRGGLVASFCARRYLHHGGVLNAPTPVIRETARCGRPGASPTLAPPGSLGRDR